MELPEWGDGGLSLRRVLGNVPIVVLGIALLSRDGDNRMPHHDEQVYEGDHVTFIVRTEAVREAIDYCTG